MDNSAKATAVTWLHQKENWRFNAPVSFGVLSMGTPVLREKIPTVSCSQRMNEAQLHEVAPSVGRERGRQPQASAQVSIESDAGQGKRPNRLTRASGP
jgi:hypothetical protein